MIDTSDREYLGVSKADLERHIHSESELARRFGVFDWSATPLGSPENWPEDLRIAVAAFLEFRHPDQKSSQEDLLNHFTGRATSIDEQLQDPQTLRTGITRRSFILQLLARLRSIDDEQAIMAVATEALARRLGISLVGYCEVEQDEETVFACGEYGDGRVLSPVGFNARQSIGTDFSRILKAGEDLFYRNYRTLQRTRDQDVIFGEFYQRVAGVAVPLLKGGRLAACLYAVHPEPRFWPYDERRLMRKVADLIWVAVERARAETASRVSEEKYRQLADSMDEGIAILRMIWDANGRPADAEVLDVNPAYEKQTGLTREQVVGQRVSKIPDTVEMAWLERFGQVVRTGMPLRFEEHNLEADRWYNVYAYSIRKNDLFGVIFSDVTEWKQLESELIRHRDKLQLLVDDQTEQLKRSERQYRTLVENIPFVITRLDKDLRYLYVSPSSKVCPAINGDAVLGRTFGEVVGEKSYYSLLEKTIKKVFKSRKGVQLEVQIPSKEGATGYYDLRVIPEFDSNGKVITVLTLSQDITADKKLEAEMLRLDRLNISGEMAAAIGHEVRNPLTTVRGYLQMFQRKAEIAKYRAQFETMIEELDRANVIISEFLALAKNKAVELKHHNLNDVISTLMPMLQSEAFRTGHDFQVNMGDIPDINMDEKEIRQLLLNLARNGLEAMDSRGTLTIATGVAKGNVTLTVIDTGRGLPPEVMDKLGTPFLTTKENGTGLGLPVCYRIAERHGAKISVKTSPQGTTFIVNFPKQACLAKLK